MHKKFLFNILGLMAIVATTTFSMQAFSSANYASSSKLANGNWVKIAIPENGIYQLTFEELSQMGFSNPEAVRIYGKGGHPISELLDGSATDDLVQIPVKVYDNKICFYGCGPVKYTLATPNGTPHYTRAFNSYSSKGYYFVTQDDGTSPKAPAVITKDNTGSIARASSLDYMHHENDLISPGQMGKNMLGENMTNAEITVPYSVPGLCGDSAITVNVCSGAKVSFSSYIKAEFNGYDMNYTLSTSKIYTPANAQVYYNWASPYNSFIPEEGNPVPQNGNIRVSIYSPNGEVNSAWLDYIILTYYHNNTLENAAHNQLNMGFNKCTVQDLIRISNTSPSVEVWNVNDPHNPTSLTLSQDDNGYCFTPGVSNNWNQYIAFDPSKDLRSIDSYTAVENQNIHGMTTPHMVIVTCKDLIPQAERVAQMHRDNDNMIVHVIDQEAIFNEFSSGTPDAMAIRLMSKMFYDRDKSRFKNLLMFGAGSYDNRKLLSSKDCQVLTYEAENSNDEEYSYVCDDFFGILDDNSGNELAKDYLRLGVGRIPCANVAEAESDVDKLINYVNNPDYGPWRNDLLLVADDFDDKLYAFQSEGLCTILEDELATGLAQNKVFCSQFPVDAVSGYAFEARKELTAKLKEGQYFMTYVGHGDKSYLTKTEQLWTVIESNTIENKYLPILTTACCDVARYDSNQRGLVEILFHRKGGGAIAMVTSARAVFAEDNDNLNQAFIRAMFCHHTKGYMPTLGEAYMLCKQSFGRTINYNKMSFMLLGDPAIKINYPKPYFKITKINGSTVNESSTVASGAMQEITVEAQVYNPNGTTVNTNFNGDATLSIYDLLKFETTATGRIGQTYVDRDIYYPRNLLTRVNGRVVDGVFTAKAVIPRYILSSGNMGCIKVYAHMDDSEEMVNGSFNNLRLNSYNASNPNTVVDDMPPVIEAMYFNDEQSFSNGALIPPGSTLYIRATDDHSFNTQSVAIGNSMSLQLDNGKTTHPYIRSHSVMSDEGRMLAIEFPMTLQEGQHSLLYNVYDAAGNKASQTISFIVGSSSQMSMTVDEEPAVDQATFNVTTSLPTTPQVTIKVLDTVGNVVWKTTTSSFPYTWDLKDNSGNRVPAGVYKFYGTYEGNNSYGGTEIGHIIVIDPYHVSN